jgi:hypothetical protein
MPLQAQSDQDLVFQLVSGSPSGQVDQDLTFIVAQRLVPAIIYTQADQDLVFAVVHRIVDLVQLVGGGYQDFLGHPLAFGYLMMKISNPVEIYTAGTEVIEGSDLNFKITLDANGNVSSSPAQYVFSTSSLTPTCEYIVTAYAADGTTASAPQIVTVPNTNVSYNISNWVPLWPSFS